MNQRVLRVHPDVIDIDLAAATAYYDEVDPRLGDQLAQLVIDALDQIEARPLIFAE